ncbi:MAG TPA: PBP1A family penicillin-binding protein [Bacteroidetes bacterium]|nr:PBP1A family penicillin-binding protein [Bacteroidota bacterium]
MKKDKSSKKKTNTPRPRWRKYLRWGIFGTIVILTLFIAIFTFSVVNNLPPMNDIENPQIDLSTQIYTADGKKLGSIFNKEDREFVPLDKISHWVQDALIATEDVRFYDHSGIDPKTPFTIIKDILVHQRLRGGSSISQQLARNLYNQVGKDNSITRKVKEAIVAVVLESRFTKEEIMQAYLNTTSYYGNSYGIEMGSQTLFNKAALDLELHEAAMMVGLLKGPSYYNPRRNPKRALNRRNTVINQMAKYGKISQEAADSTKKIGIGLRFRAGGNSRKIAPYFRDQVKRDVKDILKKKVGGEYDLFTDGLKVYTTLDSRMQHYAEKAVKEHLTSLQKTFEKTLKGKEPWKKQKRILQNAIKQSDRYRGAKKARLSRKKIDQLFAKKVAMRIWSWENGLQDTVMSPRDSVIHYLKQLQVGFMSMDPHSGEIKAWVGGINHNMFKYDHVKQGKRQVGSTFKPFVYSTAMGSRHTPCDQVLDVPVSIKLPDGKYWTPRNSGGKDDGLITYYEGLARSKNQVTAYLMKEVGPKVVCERVKSMGIHSKLDCVPSLCLGTTDLSVFEMVGAYSTFANDGRHIEPYLIKRIEDKNGQVIYNHVPEISEAMDAQTAFTMIRMLQGVVDHLRGTAHRLRARYKFKNQIGGKTGTTQNNSDGWFMGVTPDLVSGVWVGCDDRRVRFRSTRYGQGANMALPIWAIYMKYVYADGDISLPQTPFTPPEGYQEWICKPKSLNKPPFWDSEGDPDKLPEDPWGE